MSDREPQPSDGPDYWAEHAYWAEEQRRMTCFHVERRVWCHYCLVTK